MTSRAPASGTGGPHILVIPKWWPNERDPQLGDFLRKQVQAVALRRKVTVLLIEGAPTVPEQPTRADADGLIIIRSRYHQNSTLPTPLRKLVNLRRYWKAAMAGWRSVLHERGLPHLVHVHILVRPALVARWIKREHGIPYVLSDQSSEYLDGTYARKGPVFHALNRRLFKGAAAVTAVSAWLGDGLVRLGLCTRYEVVPNVVPGLDRPLPPRGDAGHFMVIADLVDRTKNVSGVIKALSSVRSEEPDTRLTIIGDGPDRGLLQDLVIQHGLDKNVVFLGRLPNSGVLEHIAHAGAVIINSNVETFSVVTGEALAQGKPVIATRCGGPQGFVTPENGVLIDVGDTDALALAILHMKRQAVAYDPVAIRRSVSNRFSPEAVGGAFVSVYERTSQDSK